jgi:hypothetical protein
LPLYRFLFAPAILVAALLAGTPEDPPPPAPTAAEPRPAAAPGAPHPRSGHERPARAR